MKKSDVADLMEFIVAFDQRTVGETDIEAWYKALAGLDDLDLCREAVVDHYQESSDPIRPAHIIRYVRPRPSESDRLSSAVPVASVLPPIPGIRADQKGPAMVRDAMTKAHAENGERRARVLKYPELAKMLTEFPLSFERPSQWTGHLATDNPEREALTALDLAARRREDDELKAKP